MTAATEQQHIAAEALDAFGQAALEECSVPAHDAKVVMRSLMSASLRGVDTHGVVTLLPVYVKRLRSGLVNPTPEIRVARDRGAVTLLDGDNGLGALVATTAVDLSADLAAEHGAAWVGVCNSNHFGAAGYYTMRAAERGHVGIAMTNGPPNMPPWGAAKAYLSSNPLSIAVPSPDGPLVLDMATSVVARLQVVQAATRGDERIPEGWALDSDGRPTTDPQAAKDGFIMPLGAHKGSGLSMMIDVLCGVLTGAAFGQHVGSLRRRFDQPQRVGHMFSAIDVSAFAPPEDFAERLAVMCDEIRNLPRTEGVERIHLPGEIEVERQRRREREGIPMSRQAVEEFQELAEELRLPLALETVA